MNQTQNPSSSRALTFEKPGDLMRFLESGKGAVAAALPKHLNPDRMLRLALTAFSTTPALRQCTGQSILASIVVASQLGLEPGVAGQGYLIPYKNTCTFVPGWQGLVGLLNNTGRATAWTGSVFEGDEFDFQLGSAPRLVHKPGENYGDPEHLKWVYACGKVNGSEQPIIEAWPIARVWKHRDKNNKVGRAHYSYNHPEMYARKVVLLQVLKYLPRSIELNNAIVAADAAEMSQTVKVVEGVIEAEPGDIEINTEPAAADHPKAAKSTNLFKRTPAPKEQQPAPPSPPADPIPENRTEPGELLPGDKPTPAQALRNLAKGSRLTEKQVLDYINDGREFPHDSLEDVGSALLRDLIDNWADILPQIAR